MLGFDDGSCGFSRLTQLVQQVNELLFTDFTLELAPLGVCNNDLLEPLRLLRLHSRDGSETDARTLSQQLIHHSLSLLSFHSNEKVLWSVGITLFSV